MLRFYSFAECLVPDLPESGRFSSATEASSTPTPESDHPHAAPTLYEWMGGAPAIERLMSRFYAAVRMIGQLDFMRSAPRAIRVIDEDFSS